MVTLLMPTDTPLARLLWFASPSFPTGGYAYSHGLEWSVAAGDITTAARFHSWLETFLHAGAGRADAILLRHAHRAAADPHALQGLAERSEAMAACAERQLETLSQGQAFAAAAAIWGPAPAAPYPVAFGAFAATQGVAEDAACTGFLAATLAALVSAGIRLIPLGQSAGLRLLRALEPSLLAIAAETACATLDDLGSAAFRMDIAAMRHETQQTRIFRS